MNFLYAEMEAFSIEPTQTTYDHLVRISSMQDNYEQAFQFIDKMKTSKTAGQPNNWWLGKGSALALIRRCIQAEDIRMQELIEECRKRGMSIDAEVQELLNDIQKQKELAEGDANVPMEISSAEPVSTMPSHDVESQKLGGMSGWG